MPCKTKKKKLKKKSSLINLMLISFAFLFLLSFASAYNHYAFDLNSETKTVHANNFTYSLLPSGIVSVSHAGSHLTNLGIALYGVVGSPNYLKSWDGTWTWQVLKDSDYNITVLGSTTYSGFEWKQEWSFQRYAKPKITHILTNNTGTTITDMKMYYILDVNESIVSNVNYYDASNQAHQFTFDVTPDYELNQSINTSDGQLVFNAGDGAYFDFTDLFSDFEVNYVFAGNLNNASAELPLTQGLIIGFTKGNGTMLNGQTVRIDPTFDDFEDNDYTGNWDYSETESTDLLSYGEEQNGYLQIRHNGGVSASARNATGTFIQKSTKAFTLNDFPLNIDFNFGGTWTAGGSGAITTTFNIYLSDGSNDVNLFQYVVFKSGAGSSVADETDRNMSVTYSSANTVTINYCLGTNCWQYTKSIAALNQKSIRLKLNEYTVLSASGGGDSASCNTCVIRLYDYNYVPDTLDFNFVSPDVNKTINSNQDYNISWAIINRDANAVGHLFDLNYGLTSNPTTVILNDGNVASTPGLWCDSNNFSTQTTCYYTWAVPDLNGDYYLKLRATDNQLSLADINKQTTFSMQDTYFLIVQYYDAIDGSGSQPDSWVITGTDYVSYCDANGLCFIPDVGFLVNQPRVITAAKTGADSNILQGTFGNGQSFQSVGALTLRRTTITLINEDTGDAWNPPADFNADDDAHIVNVIMYDINGNFLYDFNASGNYYEITVPDNTTPYNFEITYNNAGQEVKYKKEIILGLINDTNSKICVAPLQNFYEQIFTSTQEKQIIVYLPISDCYALAATLRNLYGEGQFTNVYTINKTYQAYTYSDGTQTFLAWVNGGTAYEHKLDAIELNQSDISVTVGYDTLAFFPLVDSEGADLNILQIYFKSYYGNYASTYLQIYNQSNTLLYELTQDVNANEFILNWDWNAYGFTDENMLHIVITSTKADGTIKTFTEYFNVQGNKFAGSKDPTFIAIMAILFFLFGITLTSVGKTFGWFGAVICVASMAITVIALPGTFWIPLIQAGLFICFLFIFLQGGGSKPAVGAI